MALSDKGISALKPTTKDTFTSDGRGLYLRVHTSGTKTFMYRSRAGGSARWVTLGVYPSLSLADARKSSAQLAEGMLPTKITVQTVYDDWVVKSIRKTYKSPLQVEQRMTKHILPVFGDRPIAGVKRAELSKQLNDIADTAPVQGNRVLTDVKLLFSYAVERGWLEDSPAQLITQRTVGGKEATRSRVLSGDELHTLIGILRQDRFEPATRYALALLLLTGQRSGEVRGLRHTELQKNVWRIPEKRTKTGEAQTVTLPRISRTLTTYAIKELGNVPFDGMEGQTLARAVHRMKFSPQWTPHDLRRTMATHMSDLGVAPHVVEKCLNHKMPGVMAIYNRAEYAAEKKAAWRLWTKYLSSIRKKAPGEGG